MDSAQSSQELCEMSQTESTRSGAQAWSLFPSVSTAVTDMMVHNPSDRPTPCEALTSSKHSSIISHGDQGMASPPEDIPLYRRSTPSNTRKPSLERQSPTLKVYEFSKPLFAKQGMSSDFTFTTTSLRDEFQEHSESRNGAATMSSSAQSPTSAHSRSVSPDSFRTNATSFTPSLPALQQKGWEDQLEPLAEGDLDPGSFDLIAPHEAGNKNHQYSLETRSEQLFSTEHLQLIFDDPSLLLRFTSFMSKFRPTSIPVLIYYLDAIKALKALSYSNAIAEALEPLPGFEFTLSTAQCSVNADLKEKANLAFDALVREDLPAYITHTYIQTVSLSIQKRITGTLPAHLQEASEGLAEVFCLTDPSRPDNPIVFASEEFNRTTQYGMGYILGRNCRFLQGPKTNKNSLRRIRETVLGGREHCEVFLNYRRDGSPFMNLQMTAPLCDSRGVIRYFIGAQVDVSGLVKECSDMESLKRLAIKVEHAQSSPEEAAENEEEPPLKDEFQELSEMLNLQELDTVRRWGGRMHKESLDESTDTNFKNGNWNKPRLLINSPSPDGFRDATRASGKLSGIYENYLLVRPYPSLRILFASPSLRVPGILQSPFMNKIGGSTRVRDELTQALADGRGVTARVRWISKTDMEGYNRWIHCTSLLGANGAIGVWMIVIVNDEVQQANGKRFKPPPPVDPKYGRSIPFAESREHRVKDFGVMHRPGTGSSSVAGSVREPGEGGRSIESFSVATERSGSSYTLRV